MLNSLYGRFRTRTFGEIYPDVQGFINDVGTATINPLQTQTITTLYYLLYGRYKNWSIANADESFFKDKMLNIIFMYGPTWEKRLDIQNRLRGFTEEDIIKGATQIYNHSYDPGTNPSTIDTNELDTVNDQNVNKYTRNKLDAYENLYEIIRIDVTREFINKFNNLFNPICQPQLPLFYTIEEDS